MLRELDKSHMGGFDDMHQMKERDLPYLPSGKVLLTYEWLLDLQTFYPEYKRSF